VLAVDDGKQSGLAKFGQAYVDFVWGDRFSARFGRQLHKSMFLNSSTSRAIPNTFQGASASLDVTEQLSFHGAVYDKWSRRARNEFEGFATDRSGEGDIDFVAVLGAKYEVGGVTVEGEYLESDDFMRKFGLRGTYVHMLADSSLRFTGGVFTSSDAGSLFVTGSESGDLDDEDVTGSVAGVTRSEVDGLGGYVETAWKKGNVEIAGAFTVIDEIWLEDNFTGDHGRNPFPTRSRVGPDLTNSNEKVVGARVSYNWKDIVPGLRTDLAAAYGFDAENSANSALGSADENWWELRVRYKLPMVKGLSFTGIYHDYNSDETGRVDGVKQDERDIRLYLDYVSAAFHGAARSTSSCTSRPTRSSRS